MSIKCLICGKKIKTTMLEHYKIMHPDYSFPNDWSKEGVLDE